MYGVLTGSTGSINLQATLCASSASGTFLTPHHPITCHSELRLHEDGTLECDHATIKDDLRTQHCIDHSIAILMIEEAVKRFGQTIATS